MNVLMLIWDYHPGPEGGAERQCRKLSHALTEAGHSCSVLASCDRYPVSRQEPDGPIPVYRLGVLRPLAARLESGLQHLLKRLRIRKDRLSQPLLFWGMLPLRWLVRFGFLLELRRFVRTFPSRVDVVHVHESGWLAGVGAWLGRQFHVPVVCKVRNTPALDRIGYDVPFRRRWERLRRGVHYIALHEALQEELLLAGIAPGHVVVIPNGVDMPKEAADVRHPGEVLYVGNFTQGNAHKGFDVLLKAWSMVQQSCPGSRLTLAGAGDSRLWQSLAESLGCLPSITFAGSVADLAPWYRTACVFVLPSRREGMSNALLEAQSWGLPAVVSDIPANRAVVQDGANGLVVPVDDPDALARGIVWILNETGIRERMGRLAREHMSKGFSMERVSRAIASLYADLLSQPEWTRGGA